MSVDDLDLCECKGCPKLGQCCYFSAPITVDNNDPVYVFSTVPCPHLVVNTGLCSRYETRGDIPWCGNPTSVGVRWPGFCPHYNGDNGIISVEELRERFGLEDSVEEIQGRLIVCITEKVKEDYGVDL